MCQNETIEGIEFSQELTRKIVDRVKSECPDQLIVSDMSSVLGARNLEKCDLWNSGYDLIFSGAHKNFGTSGLTFLIIKEDVMDKVNSNLAKQ